MHTHLLVIAVFLVLCGVSLYYRRQTAALVRDYFSAAGSPVNLAVFRVVLFGVILGKIDMHSLLWFSRLPTQLEFAPNHYAHILPYLPVSAALMETAGSLLLIFCSMALIGLWTPVSCTLTVLLGIYVFGVPNLFGKVNHDHHVLWFAALLAASPCSDALSVDAVRRAWKRADNGTTVPPDPARAYALPLRIVWLLMGLGYFFPGFWKLWHTGLEWALSGNLKYFMYERWTGIGGGLPMFRIDHYPILVKSAGIATLLFETTFLGLIFFPRVRPLLVLGGLFFHNMTNLFLGISFWALQWMYASFVAWDRVFLWVGRQLFPCDLCVLFNGRCRVCRRIVASLRVFDILGRIQWTDTEGRLQAVAGERRWIGHEATRVLAARIPLLWPILPLLSLSSVTALGHKRGHQPQPKELDQLLSTQPIPLSRHPARTFHVISTFLIFAVFVAGVRQDEYTWPIACYPTFDYLAQPEKNDLTLTVSDAAGRTAYVPPLPSTVIGTERYEGLMQSLLSVRDPKQQQSRLLAYWRVCQQNDPALANIKDVRFYQDTVTVVPGQTAHNPLRRTLLYEYK